MEKMKEAQESNPPPYNKMYPNPLHHGLVPDQFQGGNSPISKQPGIQFTSVGDVPPNLTVGDYRSYMKDASSFEIKQKLELCEIVLGWETNNKYVVKAAGKKLFRVREKSNCCCRQFCAERRSFNMSLTDLNGHPVLTFERDLNCSWFFGACLKDSIKILSGDGQILGSVVEEFHLFYPRFKLKDAAGNTVLKIRGPFWSFSCTCGPVHFNLTDQNDNVVGVLTKEWSSCAQECFTDADNFTLSFPGNLDPAMKAVCLGAIYLLDFRYYEHAGGLVLGCLLSLQPQTQYRVVRY